MIRTAAGQINSKIAFQISVALGVFLALLFVPLPGGLPYQGQRVLAVVGLAVVLWITAVVAAAVRRLLAVVLLGVVGGVDDIEVALSGFASPVPYFLIGILALGLGVHRSGLAERGARLLLAWVGGSPRRLFSQMVLAFVPMSFLLPSATTRNAILVHVYDRVLDQWEVPHRSPLRKATAVALGSLNRLASTALLTGGTAPVAAAALLGGMGWGRWFLLLGLPYYLLLLAGGAALFLWYRRGFHDTMPAISVGESVPWTGMEVRAAAIAGLTALLWFTDSWHHLHPAVPALLAMVLLLTPGIGFLTWSDFDRDAGWASFIIMGTSLSLANAMVESGVAQWLADGIELVVSPVSGSPVAVVMAMMVASTVIRMVIPNIVGYLALVIPVAMSLAGILGLTPLGCGLAVSSVADPTPFYPAAGPAAVIVYDRGATTGGEIFRFGLLMNLLSYALIAAVALPWWSLVGEPLVR